MRPKGIGEDNLQDRKVHLADIEILKDSSTLMSEMETEVLRALVSMAVSK